MNRGTAISGIGPPIAQQQQQPTGVMMAPMQHPGHQQYGNIQTGRPPPVQQQPPPTVGVALAPPAQQQVHAHQPVAGMPVFARGNSNKIQKLSDRILHPKVKSLVPESQAYMDLLDFENKLDTTIRRKQFDIHEALKRPLKEKKKLRVFVTSTYTLPSRVDHHGGSGDTAPTVGSWELRIEGRLLDELQPSLQARTGPIDLEGLSQSSSSNNFQQNESQDLSRSQNTPPPATGVPVSGTTLVRRKFSTYFRSLVIELDRDLYGPDNHLVEWHRLPNTPETDGFQVRRFGDRDIRCTMLFMLHYDPPQYRLEKSLARLLGLHTANRPTIVQHLWEYIKEHKLQSLDESGHSVITWDTYMTKVFGRTVMKFADIPAGLTELLYPPDPVVISHIIPCNPTEPKKVVCYDIEVELDDPLREKYQQFLLSSQSQDEIAQLDQKIFDTVDAINQLRTNRDFLLQFSSNPQQFIHKWLLSQANDLRRISDATGNPEEERMAEYYQQDWCTEAVSRYIYNKTLEKKTELEQALGMLRNAPTATAAAAVGGKPITDTSQLLTAPSISVPVAAPAQHGAATLMSSYQHGVGVALGGGGGGGNGPPTISSSMAAAVAAASVTSAA